MKPYLRLTKGRTHTVLLGALSYVPPKSAGLSVWISDTHLTWHCVWRYSNSHGSPMEIDRISIRMSMALHTLRWLPRYKWESLEIGKKMTLTRNTNRHQYCDYCKLRWGQMKDGTWHLKAQTPAVWRCESVMPGRKGRVRFYCQSCADEVQNWDVKVNDPDHFETRFWSLKEQLEYAKGQGRLDDVRSIDL